MKINKGFVLRNVGGESVVVPIGEMGKKFHGMINLNESGAFLWTFFTEEHTTYDAVKALVAEYEIDEETATKDVQAFVDKIVSRGFAQ